jgi:CSLREA domain-containing protein
MTVSARFAAVVSLAVLTWAAPAFATTITVTTTADTLITNGSCSIREAIINANNDAATWPDCAAGSGADVINLPAGTITFAIANTPGPPDVPAHGDVDSVAAQGDLDILSSMTIAGNAAGTTINGNQLDRIFDINPDVDQLPETVTPAIVVQILDLTMTNARQNQSGAVRIQARATVTIDRSTISNSTSWADDGGGIFVFADGALTLSNSTVSGNHALIMGGGIRSDGTLHIVNTTITDNDTGALFANLAQGLICGTTCTLRNSIIAGNGAAPRGDTAGTITSLGYNIIGKTSNNLGEEMTVITATTGDQFNVGAAAVELQPLAANGGPTQTHSLGAASIAIDQGESSAATTDQRGEPRPCNLATVANATGGDGADIGAFEVQGACAGANTAPDAVDDAATFEVNSGPHSIDVLANDTDAEADALTISAVTQGAHGTVVNNGTSVSYTADANFVGSDTFAYTIDDGHSLSDTATVTVTVVDTTPPELSVSTGAAALWPPNHQLENVGLSVSALDNSGGDAAIHVAVYSDEDDLAPGSGNASPDARGLAPGTLRLRSERSGSGDGRVYLIVVTATDASSNTVRSCVAVVVPKNQSASALSAVAAQAAAAVQSCEASGVPPSSFVPVGDGPVAGPHQ